MNASWDILKALSDPTRLRLLALVGREELSVAELQEILGMGQSRISSQLAHLRQAGLVTDRREGKKAFYSLQNGLPPRRLALLKAAAESVSDLPAVAGDRESLDRILLKRRQVSEKYFNLIAGRLGKNHCPGRSWEAIGHLALRLVPAITVADLGAGEGLISQLLARRAKQVWCIDNSPRMVEVGAALARRNGLANLAYRLGDIEDVPLRDSSVDLAILSQALHHAQHPQTAVDEAFRILRPGGQPARARSQRTRLREGQGALRRRLARIQGKRPARIPQEGGVPGGRGVRRLAGALRAPFRDPAGQRHQAGAVAAPHSVPTLPR